MQVLGDVDEHVYAIAAQHPAQNSLGIASRTATYTYGDIDIEQSLSLLHEHSTGAMVWHTTLVVAREISGVEEKPRSSEGTKLREYIFEKPVIELGCGTGALARLLAPLTITWLATDQRPLLKLASRNCSEMSNVSTIEFDWELHEWAEVSVDPNTTVLACDTIYNEYLVTPFASAVYQLLIRGANCALVVVQVRELDTLASALNEFVRLFAVRYLLLPEGCIAYELKLE